MTNKNTQPRDTDNIRNTRHRKMKNKNLYFQCFRYLLVVYSCLSSSCVLYFKCQHIWVVYSCLPSSCVLYFQYSRYLEKQDTER
jgi:hypothetical protein